MLPTLRLLSDVAELRVTPVMELVPRDPRAWPGMAKALSLVWGAMSC